MNANAKKWVQALRSGEYKQITGRLKTTSGHCCLGVACELFKKEYPKLLIESLPKTDDYDHEYVPDYNQDWYTFNGKANTLPFLVKDWLGLVSPTGTYRGFHESLIKLNDTGSTFLEIADKIESEPEGLFIKE